MAQSLNVKRVAKRFREMFDGLVDLSDVGDKDYHFETRSLAAIALIISCGIDATQACNCITDGYHDMGLDAIYLDENQKTLFLIQSKWRNDGSGSISQEEMNTFVSGVKRIFNCELDGANDKILAKRHEIDRALDGIGYRVQALFAHTGSGNINDFVMKPMKELQDSTNDEAGDILHFSQLDFRKIYEYLASEGVSEEISIDDVVLSNWGKVEEPYLAYYGCLSAVAVGEWYSAYGQKLFTQNLRFYKGRTDVNDGMKKVLLNDPENFLYFNNGIKILCRNITRKAKNSTTNVTGIFRLDGVSLINGAQTAGSIGAVFLEDKKKLEKANVLVQIIDMNSMSDEIAQQITRLSNTQNRIENKDYAAQDSNQERLRRELSFSRIDYLYKNGDEITDPGSQISFDEAIVALACLQDDMSYATLAKSNVGALSENINKPPYKALFNDSTNAFEVLNSVQIIRATEKILTNKKKELSGKKYGACVHGNRLIEHLVLQSVRKVEGFSGSTLSIDVIQSKISPLIDRIISGISTELDTTYATSYPANVFKNVTKTKTIGEHVYQQLSINL